VPVAIVREPVAAESSSVICSTSASSSAPRSEAADGGQFGVGPDSEQHPVELVNLFHAQVAEHAWVAGVHHLGNENSRLCVCFLKKHICFHSCLFVLAPRTFDSNSTLVSTLIGLFSFGPPHVLYVVLSLFSRQASGARLFLSLLTWTKTAQCLGETTVISRARALFFPPRAQHKCAFIEEIRRSI
jgi:hypothetical protein